MKRKGDFTSTANGRQFWPLDPRPEEIFIDDVARALSMQCRWGGHVRRGKFFSVAQHCLLVSEHSIEAKAAGLLHDAAEAYLVDVPTPIKKNLRVYYAIEHKLLKVISERFEIPDLNELPDMVRIADARALATEHRDLRTPCSFWTPQARPWKEKIVPMSSSAAERAFLRAAKALGLK